MVLKEAFIGHHAAVGSKTCFFIIFIFCWWSLILTRDILFFLSRNYLDIKIFRYTISLQDIQHVGGWNIWMCTWKTEIILSNVFWHLSGDLYMKMGGGHLLHNCNCCCPVNFSIHVWDFPCITEVFPKHAKICICMGRLLYLPVLVCHYLQYTICEKQPRSCFFWLLYQHTLL